MTDLAADVPQRKRSVWWLLLWVVVGLVVAGILFVVLGIYLGSRGIRAARSAGAELGIGQVLIEWPQLLRDHAPWELPKWYWPERDSGVYGIDVSPVKAVPGALAFLERFSDLEVLALRDDQLESFQKATLNPLHVRYLDIKGQSLNLSGVAAFSNLYSLTLIGQTDGTYLEELSKLHRLEYFFLKLDGELVPELFRPLQHANKLRVIHIRADHYSVSPRAWPVLARLPALDALAFTGVPETEFIGISALQESRSLRSLSLQKIDSSLLREVSKITRLSSLYFIQGRLELADLSALEQMTELKSLTIPNDLFEITEAEWATVLPAETTEPAASETVRGPMGPPGVKSVPSRLERLLRHRLPWCPEIRVR